MINLRFKEVTHLISIEMNYEVCIVYTYVLYIDIQRTTVPRYTNTGEISRI